MPVVPGLPPVAGATMPGKESDGVVVLAWVYSTPPRTSRASAEFGCRETYQARSDWCSPSTEISRTCLAGARWWEAANAEGCTAVTPVRTPAATRMDAGLT